MRSYTLLIRAPPAVEYRGFPAGSLAQPPSSPGGNPNSDNRGERRDVAKAINAGEPAAREVSTRPKINSKWGIEKH